METARIAVWFTTFLIFGVAVLSGPLAGGVQLISSPSSSASAPAPSAPGTGQLSIQIQSVPSQNIRFEHTEYGSDTYYLQVPDAVVSITQVEGQPMVVYKIRIPALGYTRGSTHFLTSKTTGQTNLSIEPDAFPPDEITQESYAAELVVLVRVNGAEEILARQNVTVERRA